jgi:hypothetical protein
MWTAVFLREHAVGLAALGCFAALGAYMLRQMSFTPPEVVYQASEPTTVDVHGSPEGKREKPRRVFDIETARKALSVVPDIPAPPVVRQRTAGVRDIEKSFAPGGLLSGSAPGIPPPAAASTARQDTTGK